MSGDNKALKTQNRLWLAGFVVLHLVVFWGLATRGSVDFNVIQSIVDAVLSEKGAIAAGSILLVTVLDGVFPDHLKAVIVFWRWQHPLPGCRAFSVIAKADPRIDVGKLERCLGALPADPVEQNRLWYSLYQQHRNEAPVIQAHRDYLLTREMTSLSALFVVFLPISLYVSGAVSKLAIGYGVVLMAVYTVVALASRNLGNRFVANVLALVNKS